LSAEFGSNNYFWNLKEKPVPRYFLQIAYNGTNYHGWQVQNNAITVQEVLNKALATYLRMPSIETTGCGRTDAGVHASDFYVQFEAPSEPENLIYRLNKLLPPDIAAYQCIPVADSAHTRFDATSRTYEYHFHTRKDPFKTNQSAYFPFPLDVPAMQAAAQILLEYQDFTSFSKLHTDVKTNNCKIKEASWRTNGHSLCFTITADRFLRNMVRAIVGTLLDIGKGKLPVEAMHTIIQQKDRAAAGTSVEACGLYLTKVTYPYINNNE